MKTFKYHIIYHLLFWAISFFILYSLFTKDYNNGLADVVYTILFHMPIIPLVYVNIFAIRKYLLKGRYVYYFVGMLVTIGLCLVFHYILFEQLSDFLFPGFYFISYYNAFSILQFLAVYWIISLLILLTVNWFQLKQRQIQLEQENNRVQLSALKSQLNPHFLFNSLNNIYGSIPQELHSQRTYLTKLSDALRYMLYETQDDYVLLEDELTYIENYIALEKLRLNSPEQVQFKVNGNPQGHLIAPLMLLPLIENCFKHKHPDDDQIAIRIDIDQDQLNLSTQNVVYSHDQSGGVGLSNLKKRLHLIYPNKHTLDIRSSENNFITELSINMNLE